MDRNFNENQNNEMINESQNSQVLEKMPKQNVKVDGTNVLKAIRLIEKGYHRTDDYHNKPGIRSERRRSR